ncbi:MAG: hypothetical protein ACJA0H_001572 [Francisellaceae bacterium]|jgi:hypothetical protein
MYLSIYNHIKRIKGYFMSNSIIIADSRIINLDEIIDKHLDRSSFIISTLLPRPDTKIFPSLFEKLNFYLDKTSSITILKIKLLLESDLWLNLDIANQILCEAIFQIESYLHSHQIKHVSVEPWIICDRVPSIFNHQQKFSFTRNQV